MTVGGTRLLYGPVPPLAKGLWSFIKCLLETKCLRLTALCFCKKCSRNALVDIEWNLFNSGFVVCYQSRHAACAFTNVVLFTVVVLVAMC